MADLCKQCALEDADVDLGDLRGLVPEGTYAVVICEGCGATLVDSEGRCVAPDCLRKHGKANEPSDPR